MSDDATLCSRTLCSKLPPGRCRVPGTYHPAFATGGGSIEGRKDRRKRHALCFVRVHHRRGCASSARSGQSKGRPRLEQRRSGVRSLKVQRWPHQTSHHGGSDPGQGLKPAILYNLGRVVSYTAIVGAVGAAGAAFSITPTTKAILMLASTATTSMKSLPNGSSRGPS